ncbi:T9SS type A sorting domain-containing protein [bacterium]|nr:T9SS type A sorting domain-containing protein [bacterium]
MKRSFSALLRYLLLTAVMGQAGLYAQTDLDRIREAIARSGAKWTAGDTRVSRLSPEERLRMLGTRSFEGRLGKAAQLVLPSAGTLPDSLDWRDNDGSWVTPVRNQEDCGSCWAFSATAQVESWYKIHTGDAGSDIDLSEQFILSCANVGSCAGGNPGEALSYYRRYGVPPESYFPYQGSDGIACSEAAEGWENEVVTIPGWGFVTKEEGLVDNIKNALMYHPVSASYDVYSDFSYYTGGVYEYVWGTYQAGHAVLIVGWNDADSCWICKNSWGNWWGENGYFRIKWGQCGIDSDVMFIYDGVTGGNSIELSESSVSVELQQGEQLRKTITITNPNAAVFEYSAIDLQSAFHPDQFNAWEGYSIWCGDPEIGGYGNHWLQYLDLPELDLSGTSAPVFSLKALWNIEDPGGTDPPWDGWDGWNVWVSTDGGAHFSVAQPAAPAYTCSSLWSFGEADQGWDMGPGIPGWAGKNGGWEDVLFDLSSRRSDRVVIRIAFASDMGFCSEDDPSFNGLFLDNIVVRDGASVLFEQYGDSIRDFTLSVEGGGAVSWLEIENAAGRVAAGAPNDIYLNISAAGVTPGTYAGFVHFMTNDTLSGTRNLPVVLNVNEGNRVEDTAPSGAPKEWCLGHAYPNPFNSSTVIPYSVPGQAQVSLAVFDLRGRIVTTLFQGVRAAGSYTAEWNGRTAGGQPAGSGLYLIRLQSAGTVLTRKVTMIK